jgi:hypothetical protein
LHIGASICEALAHAHAPDDESGGRAPIIHRAVSPSNVLIARDGTVKLDGFGFAKILGGVATDTTGIATWTPAYMAPEQATDRPVTAKVDVYSVALIVWELLAGKPCTKLPHDPFAIDATLRAIATRKPESLGTVRPDLPRELVAAIDDALASAPENRTVTCAELARCIRLAGQCDVGKRELRELAIRASAGEDRTLTRPSAGEDRTLTRPSAGVDSSREPPTLPSGAVLPTLPPRAPVPPPHPRSHGPLAFANTIAVMHAPVPVLPPVEPLVANDAAPNSGNVPTNFSQRPSLAHRLQRPMHWRRAPWIAAWAVLGTILCVVIATWSLSGARPKPAHALAATQPVAEPTAEPRPREGEARTQTVEPLSPEPPPSAAPAGQADAISEELLEKKLAYLTVHSSAPHAKVYVNLKLYGRIDDKLTVPCGTRFVSIGLQANRAAEPLWLAPGKMMPLPCGGSFETTMDPRALRSR